MRLGRRDAAEISHLQVNSARSTHRLEAIPPVMDVLPQAHRLPLPQ
jgi:hypothetical protein